MFVGVFVVAVVVRTLVAGSVGGVVGVSVVAVVVATVRVRSVVAGSVRVRSVVAGSVGVRSVVAGFVRVRFDLVSIWIALWSVRVFLVPVLPIATLNVAVRSFGPGIGNIQFHVLEVLLRLVRVPCDLPWVVGVASPTFIWECSWHEGVLLLDVVRSLSTVGFV